MHFRAWVHFKIAPSKNAFQNCHPKNMSKKSLKYVFPKAPSLITLTGILFAPKLIYKTHLSSNTELFSLLTASFVLIPHKIHLKSTHVTFNITISFNS